MWKYSSNDDFWRKKMRDYVIVSPRFPDLFKELTQIFKENEQIEVVMAENTKERDFLPGYETKIKNSCLFEKK
tara:strand:+ start:379 stop:597 length:219 start_codon:yes stop_codon:yes gene_type:complete